MIYSELKVYSLADCDKCKSVIQFLDSKDIQYSKVECYGDSEECDKMEDLTNFSRYPVIKLTTPEEKEIYFGYTNKIKKEGTITELSTYSVSHTYSDVENLKTGFYNFIKK